VSIPFLLLTFLRDRSPFRFLPSAGTNGPPESLLRKEIYFSSQPPFPPQSLAPRLRPLRITTSGHFSLRKRWRPSRIRTCSEVSPSLITSCFVDLPVRFPLRFPSSVGCPLGTLIVSEKKSLKEFHSQSILAWICFKLILRMMEVALCLCSLLFLGLP